MAEARKKNPVIGGILSALFPGVGQLYNEDYGKAVILIAVTITTISVLVYSLLTTVPMFLTARPLNLQSLQPGPVTALVSTTLILIALWFYGVIDAITCAQRLSAKPGGTPPEAVAEKESKGIKALGTVLVITGVIILLFQFGVGWGYLLHYGGPGLLVLAGLYLLLQGTGVLKKFRPPQKKG
ncbi:MAG: hypothetical protein GX085_03820 [Firmicutes bacterium]|nr:hypothetical protein [Bacillota bacterium]